MILLFLRIAGETSQSYNEIVTISMVSSRAIGIGAYLVRLGQRVVQVSKLLLIKLQFHADKKLFLQLFRSIILQLF